MAWIEGVLEIQNIFTEPYRRQIKTKILSGPFYVYICVYMSFRNRRVYIV